MAPPARRSLPCCLAAPIRPGDGLGPAGERGAKSRWLRAHADAAQVEAVRIPTGQHGHIAASLACFMIADRLIEQDELVVGQRRQRLALVFEKLGRALAMPHVVAVVFTCILLP